MLCMQLYGKSYRVPRETNVHGEAYDPTQSEISENEAGYDYKALPGAGLHDRNNGWSTV